MSSNDGADVHAELMARFCRLNPTLPYPALRQVRGEESERLRHTLAARFGLHEDIGSIELNDAVWHRAAATAFQVVEDAPTPLVSWLRSLGVEPRQNVYVNWAAWTNYAILDVFEIDVLEHTLALGVWCPIADDVDIFDDACDWALCVDHDGHVWLATAQGKT